MPVELLIGNDDGQRIDAGRQMLKGNAQLFKHRQNPAAKAKLRVHLVLFQMDDGKAFFAGDAGDASMVVLRLCQNHGAGVLWIVGIFHIDGNSAFLYRKNAVLMQYGGAHIGKLPQFAVRAVSYTHLDVYKRQLRKSAMKKPYKRFSKSSMTRAIFTKANTRDGTARPANRFGRSISW